MGFFDTLTSAFTGAPQVQAAADQRAYAAQQAAAVQAAIAAAQSGGIGALNAGQYSGTGAINTGFGNATNYIQGSIPSALDALSNYYNTGVNALTMGQNAGADALMYGLNGTTGAWAPVAAAANRYGAAGNTAMQMAFNALGLNGAGGNAAATAAFQGSPGYQWALGQGLDSVARGANAAGMVASGNELRESQKFGQGLADQDWYKWLDQVTGQEKTLLPMELQGLTSYAQGVAPAYMSYGGKLADLYTGQTNKLADLAAQQGGRVAQTLSGGAQSLADLASKGGLSLADLYSGTGKSIASLIQGLSGQSTSYSGSTLDDYLKTYSDAAAAQTGGSRNLWNLVGNAALAAATGGASIPGQIGRQVLGQYQNATGAPTRVGAVPLLS